MQQTQKYKLNLIESSDPFLPEGLNANTQKIEEVLKGMEDGPLAEMDARVTVLEGHKMAVGSFVCDPAPEQQFIPTGFMPSFVIIWYDVGHTSNVKIAVLPELGSDYAGISSAENGFYVSRSINIGYHRFLALC